MENSLKSIVDQSTSIIILLPTKPFFDQVAAGLTLYLSLREKKDISISSSSPMTVEFNRLVGVNKVAHELGNKNLIIKFVDYKASEIERVSYDIENGEFRLSVIPKPGVSAPRKEQAELSYAGVASDTVILVGGANDSHYPALSGSDLAGAKLVHVGTKPLRLQLKREVMSLVRPATSISEVVATLIKQGGFDLDADIATNLLMGIEEATSRFSDPGVTAETFRVVSELMQAGGKRISQVKIPRQTDPTSVVPGQFPKRNVPQKDVQKQDKQKTPKDWLEPKIYKGTSVS